MNGAAERILEAPEVQLDELGAELAAVKTPPGWRLDRRRGVLQQVDPGGHEKQSVEQLIESRISGPVWVASKTRDLNSEGWGVLVRWIDQDGKDRERAIPAGRFHEQNTALAQELASQGLAIVPGCEKKLTKYLGSFETKSRIKAVPRLGWLDAKDGTLVFLLPKRVLAKNTGQERVVFQPERHAPTAETIHADGTLEDWKVRVAEPCRGNPVLIFGLCASLSAPLIKAAGLDGGGFHFYGLSTRGKTTLLQVAASLWGCGADPAEAPELAFVRRWHATANGVEGLAAAHSDAPLILDELGTCSTADFGAVVYTLAGGVGKTRMDRTGNLRAVRTWRTLVLSSGEVTARSKIEERGKAAKAGQKLRLLDIPASAVIDDPHGAAPKDFADALKRACAACYGTAGPAFLEALIREAVDFQELRATVTSLLATATKALVPSDASPEQARALKRFALAEVAGLLAVRLELVPFSPGDVKVAVEKARDAWLRDSDTLPDVEAGLEGIRAFLLTHEARFRDVNSDSPVVRDVAGYLDKVRGLYLFTAHGFEEACAGHEPKEVARELRRRGWLFLNEGDRLTSKHQVAGKGRLGLYAVRAEVLEAIGTTEPGEDSNTKF